MDYATLIAEHDRIEALCNELLAMVTGDGDPTGAAALLHELAFAVDEHLAAEDRLIYDRMWPSDDPKTRSSAERFVTDFEQLVIDWGIYLSEWTADVIAVDWDVFREQSRSIVDRVRARVRYENELLLPVAFRAGLINLRARIPARAA